MHQMISNIAKIQKGIKRPSTSDSSIKQAPFTPASSKKPKFSLKTGSKGKRFYYPTPRKKSSIIKSPSYFNTPEKSLEELGTELPFLSYFEKIAHKSVV